jgi:hypothetical protein
MTRPLHRPISVGLVIALALALSAITPRPALAHDSCAVAQPAATGALGAVVAAVSVFDPVLSTELDCPDKFEDVNVKLFRDWATGEQAAEPRANARTTQAEEGAAAGSTAAPCRDGDSARFFECENVDMLSHVSHAELGTEFLNDMWGWTDPENNDDYALVGARNGTVFVDITDARQPRVLGIMPTASTEGGASWRDVKVYEDHAYVVSEHTDHGVQVFDLTRLRDWDGGYETYEPDARYTGHGSAHNININEDTGFAYSVGAGPTSAQLPFVVEVGDEVYLANGASFGGEVADSLTGTFALADDGSEMPTEACGDLVDFPAGAIAVADRGTCPFELKTQNAEEAGATGIVIVNSGPGTINMGGSGLGVTIPAVMISQSDGELLKAALPIDGTIAPSPDAAPCGTGLHMIDIREPKEPTFAGCFDDHDYIHDTQCVVYEGPDTEHQGREICFNSNGISYTADAGFNYVTIVDVTDKDNPISLSRMEYDGSAYSHQGWLTEDQSYFLHGDEGDEQINEVNTTTRVWDVSDLDAPEVIEVFENDTTSIDHNVYTEGDVAYAANYTSGFRVYDTSDFDGEGLLDGEGLTEVGFFDMYPENDDPTFEGGPWSNYPYFHQEDVVAVSSIDRGLFILQPQLPEPAQVCDDVEGEDFSDVESGPPHGDNIACVAGYGIAQGFEDGTFGPALDIRRDQMASFLARTLEVGGFELPATPDSAFPDDSGNEHELRIDQLAEVGIIKGMEGGDFNPFDRVSRGQMAAFLTRTVEHALDEDLTAPPAPFTDTSDSSFVDEINVVFDLGITEGKTTTTYEPGTDVRRDEMGSFLARTLQVMGEEGIELTPRD